LCCPVIYAILFLVSEGNNNMINTFDELSCEEVFELNAVCEELNNEAIEAQDADAEWIESISEK